MSTVQGLRAGMMAGILMGMTLAAGTVSAQGFSTERPGSILIFPKVVNDSNTVIQITNTSNGLTHAHCFYTDGRQVNGEPVWQVTDFELILTRQQPTHWSVAEGRPVNPQDDIAGLDPGLVPPVPPGFTGFLLCVETAVDGTPISANSLKGEATIGEVNGIGLTNNVSKYNAIAIPACGSVGVCGGSAGSNNGDNILSLDNVEYAACPGGSYLNFTAEGSGDPAIDSATNTPSIVSTNLSLVPCGMDFENLIPATTTLSIPIRNEFEENLSAFPVSVDCWFSESLDGPHLGPFPFSLGDLGTTFGKAIIRPVAGGNPPQLPVLGVANVLRTAGDLTSDTAAMNLPFCTEPSAPSLCAPVTSEIRLPSF